MVLRSDVVQCNCCHGNAIGCRVCPDIDTYPIEIRCAQSYVVSWSALSFTQYYSNGNVCRTGSIPSGCSVVDIPDAVWFRTDTSCNCAPGRIASQIPVGGDGWVNVYGDGTDSVFGNSCSVTGPGPNAICSGGGGVCTFNDGRQTSTKNLGAITVDLYCMCSSGGLACNEGGSGTKTFHVQIAARDWGTNCAANSNDRVFFRFDSSSVQFNDCPTAAGCWTLFAGASCFSGSCSGGSSVSGSITIEAGTACD